MVDSIVARANHQETSAPSTSIIEERVINNLYALGLRSKHVLPALGNAPSLLFGSQVSHTEEGSNDLYGEMSDMDIVQLIIGIRKMLL